MRKCTKARWCYDVLDLNRLSADGGMVIQPSLGVVICFASFIKPTGLNRTVSFMLDSCHGLPHFSHGGVLVVTPYSFSISHAGNGALLDRWHGCVVCYKQRR